MTKVVITASEVQAAQVPVDPVTEPKLPAPISPWAKVVIAPLVLVLPVLCLVALVVRIAMRGMPPRQREAWNSYTNALLIISGLLFTAISTALIFTSPTLPQSFSAGLVEFDERSTFPELPTAEPMKGTEIAQKLRPLVVIASPAARSWFSKREMLSSAIGTGFLIFADSESYLFATAKHVVDMSGLGGAAKGRILLNSGSGTWASADVVARHKSLDLALISIPRKNSSGAFTQPIAEPESVVAGEDVYVIGHPEGLQFSMSKGIVSRLSGDVVQISAPISPGNSGGPVFDDRGSLIGIVSSKVDRTAAPNAESLSFAVNAQALAQPAGWEFSGNGERLMSAYQKQLSLRTGSGK